MKYSIENPPEICPACGAGLNAERRQTEAQREFTCGALWGIRVGWFFPCPDAMENADLTRAARDYIAAWKLWQANIFSAENGYALDAAHRVLVDCGDRD